MSTKTEDVIDLEELISQYEESDDPNRRTHIVNPPSNAHIWTPEMTTQDMVDLARMNGVEITALCGYKFIPKHNPKKFDSCDACLSIASSMLGGF